MAAEMIEHPEPAPGSEGQGGVGASRRLFVREGGWSALIKQDNTREFCYHIEPGSDFYHQIWDSEIYLTRGAERLCLSCAIRLGVVSSDRRLLRESVQSISAGTGQAFSLEPEPSSPPQ